VPLLELRHPRHLPSRTNKKAPGLREPRGLIAWARPAAAGPTLRLPVGADGGQLQAWLAERLALILRRAQSHGMEERAFDHDDATLLFEVLFDIKALLARLVELVVGGDDDGEEEEETDES
jgi:hypothetical protein